MTSRGLLVVLVLLWAAFTVFFWVCPVQAGVDCGCTGADDCLCAPGKCDCPGCAMKPSKPRPTAAEQPGNPWQWCPDEGGYWWRWKQTVAHGRPVTHAAPSC